MDSDGCHWLPIRHCRKNRADKLLNVLIGLLQDGKLITANYVISALSHIALVKPEYQHRVVQELLKVEHYNYDTTECRNIALGKVVQAFGSNLKHSNHDAQVLEFIKRQTMNTRPATRKKAEKLLESIE